MQRGDTFPRQPENEPTMSVRSSKPIGFNPQALAFLPILSIGQVGASLSDSPTTRHLVPALLLAGLLLLLHLLNRPSGATSSQTRPASSDR